MRTKIAAMALSAAALVGIATYEGYSGTSYQDIVGVWTIGFGTTAGVAPNQKIDPVKALQRKMEDVKKFEGAIKECVKVPLYQHEYDAYLSLSYNIGPTAFCNSTLVKLLNQEKYPEACTQILRWDKAGSRTVRGLTVRREGEYRLCMGQKGS